MASDRSEGEERWRRECEECRERAGRAEEREKEREEELNQAQENLALATQERDGMLCILQVRYVRKCAIYFVCVP